MAPCGSRPALTPKMWCSPSRTRARSSPHSWFPRLPSRFNGAPDVYAPTTPALASAWQSSRASPKHTREPSPSPPGPLAGSASRCNCPPRHRTEALPPGCPAARRRGRDSNPRCANDAQRFSRPPRSTTPAPLHGPVTGGAGSVAAAGAAPRSGADGVGVPADDGCAPALAVDVDGDGEDGEDGAGVAGVGLDEAALLAT